MYRTINYILLILLATACKTTHIPVDDPPAHIHTNPNGQGLALEIEMIRGPGHNHPLMAIWVEDTTGGFIQTLYVANSIGTGCFLHGDNSEGFWKSCEVRRPAALPRWGHQRGIRAKDGLFLPDSQNPVADAYTGPTPQSSFILHTRLDEKVEGPIRLFFEINQTWDWNEYWTNNKYPDNEEYKTSCQPALVYALEIDSSGPKAAGDMKLIGRSHHSGENGELYTDLHTMTAQKIVKRISVRLSD
ncbi:MAG: hypothetical protein CSA96_07170 [Bacteroidetes bacterium]|nr:MAG: hypothetical protein CSA96_07170 [Bacteroidota bacterium]